MRHRATAITAIVASAAAFAYLVTREDWWAAVLRRLFPTLPIVVFPTASLADLAAQHVQIVAFSSALTILVGVPLGIWVTRESGRDFRELVSATADLAQTFPPIAVLALLLPLFGFGATPAIFALALYGLFPVVAGTVAGIESVPPTVVDAARGLGMGRWQVLLRVELPLAAHVIMGGIRTSTIINIGTATLAAAAGAGGLGSPIISGINTQNSALLLEGAVAAGMLAVLADMALGQVEALVSPRES
jgi:osmoprotectant transport system permease protein